MGDTARRLEKAMGRAGFQSIRSLQQALPEGTRGGTYSSVHAYLRGKAGEEPLEPPLEFLVEAARVLAVRLEWLRTGNGKMAPTGELEGEEDEGLNLWTLFERCAHPVIREHGQHVIVGAWVHALDRLISSFPEDEALGEAEMVELGTNLVDMAVDTAHKAGLWSREKVPMVSFHSFFGMYFQALALAMPEPRGGASREEFLAKFEKKRTSV